MSTASVATTSTRRAWATRLGLVLLPLLIVAGFLWATSGTSGHLHDTEAAIVNLDEGVTVSGHAMRLGQDYALALKNQESQNFAWRYGVSLQEANEGLASGRFGAAVVIPPGFSRSLTGTASQAEQATLQVERSPISGITDQVVVSQLSLAATRSLSGKVTKSYIDDILVATTDLGQSLGHTTTLAQDANAGATSLQGAAQNADKASGAVASEAARAANAVATAGAAASTAASSGAKVATTGSSAAASASAASAANSAQARAVASAAGQASAVASSADQARTSTGEVSKQAGAASSQGAGAKTSADSVAAAAAANKAAAAEYAQKVADVVKGQQDIAQQLADASKQISDYTKTTETVTKAVAAAQQAVAVPTATASAQPTATATAQPTSTSQQAPTATATATAEPTARSTVTVTPAPPNPMLPATKPTAEPQPAATATATVTVTATATATTTATATAQPVATSTASAGADAGQVAAAANQLRDVAKTIDAVVSASPSAAPVTGTDDAAKAAADNADQAATLAKDVAAAQADSAKVVTAATDAVTRAQAVQAAATDAQADVVKAQASVDGITGTITYPSPVSTCPATVPDNKCEFWIKGYNSSIEQVKTTASIEGKSAVKQQLQSAATSAATAVSAAKESVAAAQDTLETATAARDSLDATAAQAQVVVKAATTASEAIGKISGGTATSVAGLEDTASQLRGIAQKLDDLAEAASKGDDHGDQPSPSPTATPSDQPTSTPSTTTKPTPAPTPTDTPTTVPSETPTTGPTQEPTVTPAPTVTPTAQPTPGVDELKAEIAQALGSPEVTRALQALPEQGKALNEQAVAVTAQASRNAKAMTGIDPSNGGTAALDEGTAAVGTTAAAQAAVVQKLQDTLTSLTAGMDTLGTAISGLGVDSASLSTSTSKVNDSAAALATQVSALDSTIGTLQQVATQAAADTASTAEKAAALQQQISTLQQASGVLSTQTAAVVGQAGDQVARTGTVVHELEANRAAIPAYDDATRERLSTAASAPITTSEQSAFRNVGMVSMLMLLALWAGAMGLHSLYNPISNRARTSTEAPWTLLAHEMLPTGAIAVAQALAVAVAGQVVLHLPAGRCAAVTGALVLVSLMFAAIQHVLVTFGRMWGRLLAVAFALVTGSGIITQGYSDALGVLRNLSPISPALDLVRSLMTGVPMGGLEAIVLAGWFGAGVLFSALAILRAREPEPVRVPTVHDEPVEQPVG